MRKIILGLLFASAFLFASNSFASVGLRVNGVFVGTATDLNLGCGSGAQAIVTSDGGIYNVECNANLLTTGAANGGVTSMTTLDSVVSPTFTLVRKAIASLASGGAQTGTLANGIPGEMLSFVITSVGASGTFTLTPATTTGFTNLKFTAAGDQAVLLYVNDTIGWISLGVDGSVTVGHSGNN